MATHKSGLQADFERRRKVSDKALFACERNDCCGCGSVWHQSYTEIRRAVQPTLEDRGYVNQNECARPGDWYPRAERGTERRTTRSGHSVLSPIRGDRADVNRPRSRHVKHPEA